MTAWICELEAPYCLDVNRKGYSGLHVLPHLRMNQQPLAIATGFHTLHFTLPAFGPRPEIPCRYPAALRSLNLN